MGGINVSLPEQDTVFLSKEQTLYQPPIKDNWHLSTAGVMELNGYSGAFLKSSVKGSQNMQSNYVNISARTDQTNGSLYKKNRRACDYGYTSGQSSAHRTNEGTKLNDFGNM